MELYSIRSIRPGEEVTIYSPPGSEFKTGDVHFVLLCLPALYQGIYLQMPSMPRTNICARDRRGQMLKEEVHCGMRGKPVSLDYSAKTLNIEKPSNFTTHYHGPNARKRLPRRSGYLRARQIGLLRRIVKLLYEDGIFGDRLFGGVFIYTMVYLEDRGKQLLNSPFLPSSDLPGEFERCIKLIRATEILLRTMLPQEPHLRVMRQAKDFWLSIMSQEHIREPSATES